MKQLTPDQIKLIITRLAPLPQITSNNISIEVGGQYYDRNRVEELLTSYRPTI